METIEARILDAAVEGVNLKPGTLRDQIDAGMLGAIGGGETGGPLTLLVFLRHLG